MIESNKLEIFLENLKTVHLVIHQPFLTLYENFFSNLTKELLKEIEKNLSSYTTNKIFYLDSVKSRIERELPLNENSFIIKEWIEKYQLSESNFPFLENDEVKRLLSTSISSTYLPYEEKNNCKKIQMDFFNYVATNEKYEIIEHIDRLLGDIYDEMNSRLHPKKTDKTYLNHIKLLYEFSYLFEPFETWPDIKCDIVEVIDEIKKNIDDDFVDLCLFEIKQNLYINKKPSEEYMSELDSLLNRINGIITNASYTFKEFNGFVVGDLDYDISLKEYFKLGMLNFKAIYNYGKSSISDVRLTLKQEKNKISKINLNDKTESAINISTILDKDDPFNQKEVNFQAKETVNKIPSIENPYPRIFTTTKAFNKFKNLVDEFGNTKENLANYSFVYHRMKKDKFIFDDYQQTQFVFFLLDFDINISRIKPKSQLGNNDLREGIYNRI